MNLEERNEYGKALLIGFTCTLFALTLLTFPVIANLPKQITQNPITDLLPKFHAPAFAFSSPTIVQTKGTYASAAATANVALTTNPRLGDILAVVISATGDTSHAISSFTFSDSLSNTYTQQIRTTDQGNSLGVAIGTATVTATGSDTITGSWTSSSITPHTVVQVYDLRGIESKTVLQSNQREGGALPQATQSTGSIVISGAAGNAGGGAYTFSGTFDSSGLGATNGGAGSGSGSWSGLTSVTYVEEADVSFNTQISIHLAQSASAQIMNGAVSGTLAYGSGVTSGQMLVAVGLYDQPENSCGANCEITDNVPTDTLGDSFSRVTFSNGNYGCAGFNIPSKFYNCVVFYTAIAKSSGADTVSFSVNANAGNVAIQQGYASIYELIGVPTGAKLVLKTAQQNLTASSACCSITSYAFFGANDFIINGASDDSFVAACGGASSFATNPNPAGWSTDQNTAAGSCQFYGTGHVLNTTLISNTFAWSDVGSTLRDWSEGMLEVTLTNSSTVPQVVLSTTSASYGAGWGDSGHPVSGTLTAPSYSVMAVATYNAYCASGDVFTAPTPSDTKSSTWHNLGQAVGDHGSGIVGVVGAFWANVPSAGSDTVTLAGNNGVTCSGGLSLYFVNNTALYSIIQQGAFSTSTGIQSVTLQNLTGTAIGTFSEESTQNSCTITPGVAYTANGQSCTAGDLLAFSEYSNQPPANGIVSFTQNGNPAVSGAAMALSFKSNPPAPTTFLLNNPTNLSINATNSGGSNFNSNNATLTVKKNTFANAYTLQGLQVNFKVNVTSNASTILGFTTGFDAWSNLTIASGYSLTGSNPIISFSVVTPGKNLINIYQPSGYSLRALTVAPTSGGQYVQLSNYTSKQPSSGLGLIYSANVSSGASWQAQFTNNNPGSNGQSGGGSNPLPSPGPGPLTTSTNQGTQTQTNPQYLTTQSTSTYTTVAANGATITGTTVITQIYPNPNYIPPSNQNLTAQIAQAIGTSQTTIGNVAVPSSPLGLGIFIILILVILALIVGVIRRKNKSTSINLGSINR